jgi:leucyl/phenylalanyl-tRNA--protein transferase
MIFHLDSSLTFPDPALAEPDGLLAVGGDLSPQRLRLAYAHGIFPWYSDETPILWYAPHERFVLFPNELRISKSMRKILRSERFIITVNQDFRQVITACSICERTGQDDTWITNDMIEAYVNLHNLGYANAVEVWENNMLVGGLYGVATANVFCGESMFSKVSNASKLALVYLCQYFNYQLIDCQVYTEHLESMGARMISRESYLSYLK